MMQHRTNDPDIMLWWVPLDVSLSGAELCDEEWHQSQTFRHTEARRRFIARRVALRRILAIATDGRPETLRFSKGPKGKPALASDSLEFSVSRSHDHALIGVANVSALGVDLEYQAPRLELDSIADIALSPAERKQLPQSGRARAERILRLWCAKEACLKQCGEGLSDDLAALEITYGDGHIGTALLQQNIRLTWNVRWLSPAAGYCAAVATVDPATAIALRLFDWAQSPG